MRQRDRAKPCTIGSWTDSSQGVLDDSRKATCRRIVEVDDLDESAGIVLHVDDASEGVVSVGLAQNGVTSERFEIVAHGRQCLGICRDAKIEVLGRTMIIVHREGKGSDDQCVDLVPLEHLQHSLGEGEELRRVGALPCHF